LSTVRARLGVVSGPWLAYATGGVAIAKVNTGGVFTPAAAAGGPNAGASWDQSTTKAGWTLGLGVENALTSNWSWKLEYLYVNLGSVTGSGAVGSTNCYGSVGICANTSAAGTAGLTTKITDNIVRVGVNYKFGN
jgi:outer membrane immunogenic protein